MRSIRSLPAQRTKPSFIACRGFGRVDAGTIRTGATDGAAAIGCISGMVSDGANIPRFPEERLAASGLATSLGAASGAGPALGTAAARFKAVGVGATLMPAATPWRSAASDCVVTGEGASGLQGV